MDLELHLPASFMHLKRTNIAQCSFTILIELRNTSTGGVFMVKFCLVTPFIMFFEHASSLFVSPQCTITFSRLNWNTLYLLTYKVACNLPLQCFLIVKHFERITETPSLLCLNILLRRMLKQFVKKCPAHIMADLEPTGMGKTLLLFFFFFFDVYVLIVTRLLFITAGMNSYHKVEDDSQSVIVISVVGEKSFLYFIRFIFIFKNIFLFDNLLFFYLVAVFNIITWMVMITGIAVGMF